MTEYKAGDYLYHPDHGVGRIRDVVGTDYPDLVIDFERQPGYSISARLADQSMQALSADGFRALAYDDHDRAIQLLDDAPARAIALVLKDFPRQRAKNEDIKDYLSSYVKDWSEWWKRTQQLLKEASYIDTSNSKSREYGLREAALSRLDEAFEKFQRLQRQLTRSTTSDSIDLAKRRKGIYDQAKQVLTAFTERDSRPANVRESMQSYFLGIIADSTLEAEERLDPLSRLYEIEWLSKDEYHAVLRDLITAGLRIYRISVFSQTRLLEFLLENAEGTAEVQTLLTGLCAEPDSVNKVVSWLLRRGDPLLVVSALQVMLTDYIPPALPVAKYDTLRYRLDRALQFIDQVNADITVLTEIVGWMQTLIVAATQSPQTGLPGRFPHAELMRLASVLYRRTETVQAELSNNLVAALANPDYPSGFLSALLDAQTEPQISIELAQRIESYLLEHVAGQHDNLVSHLLATPDERPIEQLTNLVEKVHHHKNVHLLDSAAQRAVEICRKADNRDLLYMLTDLDRLSRRGEGRQWQTSIDTFRERGYVLAFQEAVSSGWSAITANRGVLDLVLIRAIREFVRGQTSTLQEDLNRQQQQTQYFETWARELEAQLGEREQLLGELRRGLLQGSDTARFEERVRIMRDFATSVSEFERFSSRQSKPSPEVEGMLRRFNSLMKARQVTPMEPIGAVVPFNSEQCRLIDDSIGEEVDPIMVEIVERGYWIEDPTGTKRPLKSALVRRADAAIS